MVKAASKFHLEDKRFVQMVVVTLQFQRDLLLKIKRRAEQRGVLHILRPSPVGHVVLVYGIPEIMLEFFF